MALTPPTEIGAGKAARRVGLAAEVPLVAGAVTAEAASPSLPCGS